MTTETDPQPVRFLIVDDDEIDRMSLRRAFRNARVLNEITEARDGLEALEILRNTHATTSIERPFVILLDLNMPRLDGLGFLEQLRDDPELHNLVVFVLTTSNHDQDLTASYEKQIAGYILKQNLGKDFLSLVEMLGAYWRVVELPTQ